MRINRSLILAAGTVLAVASCKSDSTTGGNGLTSGSTRTLLTDGPFPFSRVSRVDLFVLNVSASLSPDTSATSGGNFVTLATPNRLINVLALQNGATDELGATDLPEGAITAVRLTIDTDKSSITLKDGRVLTATSHPSIQWQSSAGQPVLNALVLEQIQVPDTGAVVVIDYDVGQAFISNIELNPGSTDSGFIFSPVLRAADAKRTGTIRGTVKAHTAGGAAVADASLRLYWGNPANNENTWYTIQTAKTGANGSFQFSFVTRTGWWKQNALHANSTYIVAFDPPPASGVARVVTPLGDIMAGDTTAMGTVVLP